ncbi:pilus assembly protein [Phyllobacterium salinisoli]|uniref:Pilus assembly protein n=1 Tax=Phyllobacterium salinisoli TaxID=1899321 RepID=A0A368K6K9_9HYPH|nr:type II secretion system F family protein [Phyllobacterium salinisoli]RCS25028.1 pilus assembly protein [Phyllobacterium salinisoli]
MFGFSGSAVAFALLAAIAAAALVYVILYDRIAEDKARDRRLHSVKQSATTVSRKKADRDRVAEVQRRRKTLQDNLNDMESRQKQREKSQKSPPLRMFLAQAGLNITVRQFYIYSVIAAVTFTVIAIFLGVPMLLAPGIFLAGAFGLPRWFVGYMRSRRIKAFLNEFPNALDVIVRSVRSGLPLNDGLRLIASEAREPVRAEFRRIVESQQMGLSIPEATAKMPDSMPCPEANFFAIVIQIQSQAGGNLSEALSNLSRVLRDRKKMKAKVNALSMEAKASAAIIGALPFIVTLLVYLSSPQYILVLFTSQTGHLLLGISAVLMTIGILIMRKMINFTM